MSGTKVTTDPESYDNPISEKPGPVTSDSLAAESEREAGKFSENKSSAPYDVNSSSSTFATTDTSAASTLDPAPNADSRLAKADSQKDDKVKGVSGLKYTEGLEGQGEHPDIDTSSGGYAEGSTESKLEKQSKQDDATHESGKTSGASSGHAGVAPGYVKGDVTQFPLDSKPKGKNLTEGGFDSDAPNASFNNDIGGEDDPGRLAEGNFQKRDSEYPNTAGFSSTGDSAGGLYNNLKDENA